MQLTINNRIIWLILLIIEFYLKNVKGLQIIPYSDDDYYSSQSQEEIVYFKNERAKKSNPLTTQSMRYIKPSIQKYFLKNVTVTHGDFVKLECPTHKFLFNEALLDSPNEPNKVHIRDIHFDESMKIKTVIWTQELDFPKIITNNEEILVKNGRFKLVSEDSEYAPRKNHDKNSFNEEYAIKQSIPYNLQICPVKNSDSGWYSCYVVKRSLNDQNIKFYTYVSVLNELNQNQDYDDYENEYDSFEIESKYESYCNQLIFEKNDMPETNKNTSKANIDNFNNKEVIESSFNYKNHDSTNTYEEKEYGKIVDKKDVIETQSNETKTMDLKRQIDLLIKKNQENTVTESVQKQHGDFLFDINSSENLKLKSTEFESEENYKTVKRETLIVSPKQLNVSAHKSTQLDCIYNGPQYLSIKLVWLKNGIVLNKNNQNTRFLILDYIQHNASICILKFSYALAKDAGTYTCSATQKINEKSFLNDSAKIIIDPRPNDNYLKFSSYLQDDGFSNNAVSKTKKFFYICILFVLNLLIVM